MNIDPSALLKLLGNNPRVAGLGSARPNVAAPTGVEPGVFADLLSKARGGELSSNQPVTIDPDCASSVKLTPDQLAQIAIAADKAEASGIRKALVVLDDQQLMLDVSSRTLKAASSDSGSVVTDIDGVINLATKSRPAALPPLQPPSAALSSSSLVKLLAEQQIASAA